MTDVLNQPASFYSTLACDPDLGELVDLFVSELPDRVNSLSSALANGDWESLGRYAHQLKGAAGSYGFDQLTPSLRKLEALTREQGGKESGAEQSIREALADVSELCSRVRSGVPSQR